LSELLLAGVLCPINTGKVRSLCGCGSVVIKCGDGDQSAHFMETKREIIANDRIHIISMNGGALNLPFGSKLVSSPDVTKFLLGQVTLSRELKKIESVFPSVHFPCGAAQVAGFTDVEVMQYLFSAKQLLLASAGIPRKHLHPLVHVDWSKAQDHLGGASKGLYFAKKTQWEKYCNDKNLSPYFVPEVESCESCGHK
jgi:hypothetical protein